MALIQDIKDRSIERSDIPTWEQMSKDFAESLIVVALDDNVDFFEERLNDTKALYGLTQADVDYIVASDLTLGGGSGASSGSASDVATYSDLEAVTWTSNLNNLPLTTTLGWEVTLTSNINLTGIIAPAQDEFRTIVNLGPNFIKIKSENSNSSAANRIRTSNDVDYNITQYGIVTFVYLVSQSRWYIASTNSKF